VIKKHAAEGGQASVQSRLQAARQRAADLAPVIEEIRAKGVTLQCSIARKLNAQGHIAPRGGPWTGPQVMHLLRNNPRGDRRSDGCHAPNG
jgi:hypothetical protein